MMKLFLLPAFLAVLLFTSDIASAHGAHYGSNRAHIFICQLF